MTNLEEIKRQFALIGTITDEGAALFAADNGIDPLADADAHAVSSAFDALMDSTAFRSSSVSENGFSMSFSNGQIRQLTRLKLAKYGITPNSENAAILGLNVIRDATKRW